MGNTRMLVLLGVSLGWLAGCREEPSRHAETTVASASAHGASRWIEQEHADTALVTLLAEHARHAAEQGLRPVLYVGASWCQPCKLLLQHRDDPRVVNALRGTYTVEVDFDDWTVAELGASGYDVQAVPVLLAIGPDGKAAGPRLDGAAWGGDVEHMAAAFEEFFQQP
jgi:thiol:disulfide interchange protein